MAQGRPGHWHFGLSKSICQIELIVPDQDLNPSAYATAQFVAASWRSIGITGQGRRPVTPRTFVGERLSQAKFAAAVLDINIGLDPDLYSLLGVARPVHRAAPNFSGVQSLVLGDQLNAARKAGTLASLEGRLGRPGEVPVRRSR